MNLLSVNGLRARRCFFLAAVVVFIGDASGQDAFSERLRLPSGFSNSMEVLRGISGSQSRFDGLDLTLSLSSIFDSNVTLGSDSGAIAEESDWLTTPSARATYTWGNANWQLGGKAYIAHQHYHDLDDLRNTNYGVAFFGGYKSRKISASFSAGFDSIGGVNRISASFLDQTSFTTAVSGGYRISKKTSLHAYWDSSNTETNSTGFGDTSSRTFGFYGLWGKSSRLTFGPGFRYGVRSGVDDEDFTVFGPSLEGNYELSSKVNLTSSIGFDWIDSPYGGDDTYANWSISFKYRASSLWGIDFSTVRDTQAFIGEGGGFDLISAYRFSYWRKIKSLRATLGISYSDRRPTDNLDTASGFRDGEFISLSSDFSYPIFKDNAEVIFSVGWSDQSTKDINNSWDRFQTGIGLDWSF